MASIGKILHSISTHGLPFDLTALNTSASKVHRSSRVLKHLPPEDALNCIEKTFSVYTTSNHLALEFLTDLLSTAREIFSRETCPPNSGHVYIIALHAIASTHFHYGEFKKTISLIDDGIKICVEKGFLQSSVEMLALRQLRKFAREEALKEKVAALTQYAKDRLLEEDFSSAINTLNVAINLQYSQELIELAHLAEFKMNERIQKDLERCHVYCNNKQWDNAVDLLLQTMINWNNHSCQKTNSKQKFKNILAKLFKAKDSELSLQTKEAFQRLYDAPIYEHVSLAESECWLRLSQVFKSLKYYDKATYCASKGALVAADISPLHIAIHQDNQAQLLIEQGKIREGKKLYSYLLERTRLMNLGDLQPNEQAIIQDIKKRWESQATLDPALRIMNSYLGVISKLQAGIR